MGGNAWVNPPPHLLPQVAEIISGSPPLSATLIVPRWEAAAWMSIFIPLFFEYQQLPGEFQSGSSDSPRMPGVNPTWKMMVFRFESNHWGG